MDIFPLPLPNKFLKVNFFLLIGEIYNEIFANYYRESISKVNILVFCWIKCLSNHELSWAFVYTQEQLRVCCHVVKSALNCSLCHMAPCSLVMAVAKIQTAVRVKIDNCEKIGIVKIIDNCHLYTQSRPFPKKLKNQCSNKHKYIIHS